MIVVLVLAIVLTFVAGEIHNPLKMQRSLTLKNALNSSTTLRAVEEKKEKLGVLLLNLGGPETLKDVEGFLYNLFADPDIIRLPGALSLLQKPLAYAVAKSRSKKSSAAYASIGGGSPIVRYTKAQADLLQSELVKRGYHDAKCYFAMRYWHPFTDEALNRIEKDEITKLVILPLYPHYSISTSGSSFKALDEIFKKQPDRWSPSKVAHTVIPSWYNRPGYISTMARLILNEIKSFSPSEMREGVHILFSAHGVPESYIAAGDPYKNQIEECVRLIVKEVARQLTSVEAKRLLGRSAHLPSDGQTCADLAGDLATNVRKLRNISHREGSEDEVTISIAPHREGRTHATSAKELTFHLSFQSRVGPVKWLQPYTDVTIESLGKEKGVKNLVVVPISFVSEHIETLEEIDQEYKELALHSGVKHWRRVPALNTEASFIKDMSDMVEEALVDPVISVSEVTSTNLNFLQQQALCLPGKHRPTLGTIPTAESVSAAKTRTLAWWGAVTGVCTLALTAFNLLLPC